MTDNHTVDDFQFRPLGEKNKGKFNEYCKRGHAMTPKNTKRTRHEGIWHRVCLKCEVLRAERPRGAALREKFPPPFGCI